MQAAPQFSIEQRLERVERVLADLRFDFDRDMSIVIQALRVIGKALDVKLELHRIAEGLEKK